MFGSLISAGLSIAGALGGKASAERAGAAQIGGVQEAIGAREESFEEALKRLEEGFSLIQSQQEESMAMGAPYRAAGEEALGMYQNLLFGDPEEQMEILRGTPGYQFRFEEGQKAVERGAAARSSRLGGGTLKALTQYGQEFATGEYGNLMSRVGALTELGAGESRFGAQLGMTGAGQQYGALRDISQLQTGYGQDMASLFMGEGAARAGSILGRQEARQGLYGSLGQAAGVISGGQYGGGSGTYGDLGRIDWY